MLHPGFDWRFLRRTFMRRRTQVALLLAALVASGPMYAAETSPQASRGQATASATPKAAAPVPVKPADVAPLLGTWAVPLETPTGRLVASLVFRVEAGKVVAGISAPQLPEQKTSEITKAGQVFTVKASMDYQGPLAAYAGPVTMVLTLTPKGQDYAAWFDFNNAGYQIGGTATKKK
jgi:hypothetical protein